MILKDKKIVFVHIPKTAGQSVTDFLLRNTKKSFTLNLPKMGLVENLDLSIKGPQNHHHMFLDEYVDLGYVNKDDLKNYFKFCVLRNPFDKFISSFYYKRLHKKYSYITFLEEVYPTLNTRDDVYRHFCPQTNYINSSYGKIDKFFILDENFNNNFSNYFFENYNFKNYMNKKNELPIKVEKIKPLDEITMLRLKKIYRADFKLYHNFLKHKLDHPAK